MDWSEWIKAAATAGIISAAINQGIGLWREKADQKRLRYATVLPLVARLEGFAINCADAISEAEEALNEANRKQNFSALTNVAMPTFEIPDQTDWKWVNVNLSCKIMTLPELTKYSREVVNHAWGMFPADAAVECQKQSGLRGKYAWDLASRLRENVKLPAANYDLGEWNFIETLATWSRRANSKNKMED